MVAILNAEQSREVDAFTIENEPISSEALMERAASRAFLWIKSKYFYKKNQTFYCIFTGTGNNGGDGLVIARKLIELGAKVRLFIVELGKYSDDFQKNLDRLPIIEPIHLKESSKPFSIATDEVVVDAIFGSGLNRPIEGFAAEIVQQINQANQQVIAIDIPSGLFSERNMQTENNAIIKATTTLCFQYPKLAFFFPQNQSYLGKWNLLPIGLDSKALKELSLKYFMLDQKAIQGLIKERSKFQHKGDFGHALLIAGSYGKVGAAVLASKACLKSGVGLLSVLAPKCAYEILQSTVPEAMCLRHESEMVLENEAIDLQGKTIGIGPGMGKADSTVALFETILKESKEPMVIDADALNILAEHRHLLAYLPKNSILTPHPGEFKRLAGEFSSDYERLKALQKLASDYHCIVLLKGAHTAIALPNGKVYFNATGNVGMATGGSGDTLTGMLTAFLAQGYSAEDAAKIGVYLHGMAADLGVKITTTLSLTPTDLIDHIGLAYGELSSEL